MYTVKIKKGSLVSQTVTLGHHQLSTVFVPATNEGVKVTLFASHDGSDFGPILKEDDKEIFFYTQPYFSVKCFDSNLFEGVMYLEFRIPKEYETDLNFPIYLKEF